LAWRGYFPPARELTSGRPDRKEGIYFGVEHSHDHPAVLSNTPMHGPNQWPSKELTAGIELKDVLLQYLSCMESLGHKLMEATAIGLGLKRNYFRERFTDSPTMLFRIFHYPEHVWNDEDDEWGVREHTDMGFLTILKQDNSGGLQVQSKNGIWISAPPIENTFVVNIGDMLEFWTHGLYKATLHRVRNAASHGRLSFPFFFDPNWTCTLEPIPEQEMGAETQRGREVQQGRLSAYQNKPRWDGYDLTNLKSITYGQFVWSKISTVFPNLVPKKQQI